ncbi:hypothetical protein [Flavobacterium piscisymbiosum]|uniref:Uncharacterized protein n=1 Tax=Flavobacterium piscisymbiosum TaxID=2893753 RepID=A0ABS8MLC1_9FLAO|nr:hypothetical protein [Flavobacterium sp. F-30]MCC9066293.1 hypothetical protein [Flavobacterium sp. F-30]
MTIENKNILLMIERIQILNEIVAYFADRNRKSKARKAALNRAKSNYEALINELRLIQEKKSKLSRREREIVVLQIKYLISKGHIQVKN